jgi:hypothetical protein
MVGTSREGSKREDMANIYPARWRCCNDAAAVNGNEASEIGVLLCESVWEMGLVTRSDGSSPMGRVEGQKWESHPAP